MAEQTTQPEEAKAAANTFTQSSGLPGHTHFTWWGRC